MGPGFDALGLALAMYLEVRVAKGDPLADGHPSQVAFTSAGGEGPISVRSQIPMGRGLGFSGAARVAGVLAALAQQHDSADVAALAQETLARSAVLEGHEDNVAASLYGGVVAVAGGRAVRVPLGIEPAIVVWVPTARTSTEESRGQAAHFGEPRGRVVQRRAHGTSRRRDRRGRHRRAAVGDGRSAASGHPARGCTREPSRDGCGRRRRGVVLVAVGVGPDDRGDGVGGRCPPRCGSTTVDWPSACSDSITKAPCSTARLRRGRCRSTVASGCRGRAGLRAGRSLRVPLRGHRAARSSGRSRRGSARRSWCCAEPSVTTRVESASRRATCVAISVRRGRRCADGALDVVTMS